MLMTSWRAAHVRMARKVLEGFLERGAVKSPVAQRAGGISDRVLL